MVTLSSRARGKERLDESHHDPRRIHRTLDHMAGVNRWLGGSRVVLEHVKPCLRAGDVRILDVGTGAGDIPRQVTRWASRRGRRVTFIAVDRQHQIAQIARDRSRTEPEIRVSVGDGLRLPFPPRSFDVVISSMTLHHLEDDETTTFVSELGRVARHIVIVNDLERHRINYAGAKVLAHTVWRSDPYTRHDGPLSVRRSFTKGELLSIGRRAGLEDPRVHRHFPYRLALVGRPAGAESS
jgi:ubiquinone/menaquinone biosynthesis C-methylase UbiE